MIYWAPLLHLYQPPTQLHGVLEKIVNESYRPLIKLYQEYPQAKVTININGGLTEMLKQRCFGDVVDGLGELAARGQIEFTGSGKYHPILPLIPQSEVRRQIVLNTHTNQSYFGATWTPKGFFPPEMAYSREILDPIIEVGDRWIILSGIACPVEWPVDVVHKVSTPQGELFVFFRDDVLSNQISFKTITSQEFLSHLQGLGAGDQRKNVYVVTAMDGETFGHHIKNWERLFLAEVFEALEMPEDVYQTLQQPTSIAEQHRTLMGMTATGVVQVVTISQLLDLFPAGRIVDPKPSSWSTTADDIKAGNYYPLWDSPGNQVHKLLWEHMRITIDLMHRSFELADNDDAVRFADVARGLLDHALHSDQFWWASQRPMWDINLINKGLLEQEEVILNAFKSINSSGEANLEEKREEYYRVIVARAIRGRLSDYLFFGDGPRP